MMTSPLMLLLLRGLLLAGAVLISMRIDADWDELMTYVYAKDIATRDLRRDTAWFVELAQEHRFVTWLMPIVLFLLPGVATILWSQHDRRHPHREMALPVPTCLLVLLTAGFLLDSCLRLGAEKSVATSFTGPNFLGPAILAAVVICAVSEVAMHLRKRSPIPGAAP